MTRYRIINSSVVQFELVEKSKRRFSGETFQYSVATSHAYSGSRDKDDAAMDMAMGFACD
jgi:hypothetical protein